MSGGLVGFTISLFAILLGSVGWLWLLWGTLIGAGAEILLRVGGGADFGEAFADCLEFAILDGAFDGDGGSSWGDSSWGGDD